MILKSFSLSSGQNILSSRWLVESLADCENTFKAEVNYVLPGEFSEKQMLSSVTGMQL